MEKVFEESWFYAPISEVGESTLLSKAESHHLTKVLRVQPGRRVIASNGKGKVFVCDTESTKDSQIFITAIESYLEDLKPPIVHLILSLLKGSTLEDPVEGLCQMNIKAIHLIITDHTIQFNGQNHEKMLERLRTKSLVAMKQAKKPWLTKVEAPLLFKSWRDTYSDMKLIILAPGSDHLPERFEQDFGIVVGPEGGFSKSEMDWLDTRDVFKLGLGRTRLRGSLAPLIGCGKLMGLNLWS